MQEQFSKVDTSNVRPRRSPKQSESPVEVSESTQFEPQQVEESTPVIDSYELAEPLKILDRIPGTFEEMIESAKWKDRKEALDELATLLKTPRLEDGHYGPLVQTLSKKLADANILVVISAANCITALSNGLRKGFMQYRIEVIPALLERCKEKKANVLEALRTSLDTLGQYSLPSMFEMTDMLASFIGHKNPQVKAECLSWLSRLSIKPTTKKDLRPFLAVLLPTLDDSAPEVRESSSKLIAKLISVSGESNVAPFMDSLDKNKLSKIVELAGRFKSAVPSAAVAKPQSSLGKTRSAPPSTPAKARSDKSAGTPNPRPAQKLARKEMSASMRHSDDDALSVFEQFVNASIFTDLSDTTWKVRLESLEALLKVDIPSEVDSELLVRFLGQRPGWKESNFQVYQRMFQLIKSHMNSKGTSPEALMLLAPWASEKLADAKIGPEASECLLISAEFLGLGFVLNQVFMALKSQKSPKTQAEILKWIRSALVSFGTSGLNVDEFIAPLTLCITSTNPTVRAAALNQAATGSP